MHVHSVTLVIVSQVPLSSFLLIFKILLRTVSVYWDGNVCLQCIHPCWGAHWCNEILSFPTEGENLAIVRKICIKKKKLRNFLNVMFGKDRIIYYVVLQFLHKLCTITFVHDILEENTIFLVKTSRHTFLVKWVINHVIYLCIFSGLSLYCHMLVTRHGVYIDSWICWMLIQSGTQNDPVFDLVLNINIQPGNRLGFVTW
jgi:hypothetical protein